MPASAVLNTNLGAAPAEPVAAAPAAAVVDGSMVVPVVAVAVPARILASSARTLDPAHVCLFLLAVCSCCPHICYMPYLPHHCSPAGKAEYKQVPFTPVITNSDAPACTLRSSPGILMSLPAAQGSCAYAQAVALPAQVLPSHEVLPAVVVPLTHLPVVQAAEAVPAASVAEPAVTTVVAPAETATSGVPTPVSGASASAAAAVGFASADLFPPASRLILDPLACCVISTAHPLHVSPSPESCGSTPCCMRCSLLFFGSALSGKQLVGLTKADISTLPRSDQSSTCGVVFSYSYPCKLVAHQIPAHPLP